MGNFDGGSVAPMRRENKTIFGTLAQAGLAECNQCKMGMVWYSAGGRFDSDKRERTRVTWSKTEYATVSPLTNSLPWKASPNEAYRTSPSRMTSTVVILAPTLLYIVDIDLSSRLLAISSFSSDIVDCLTSNTCG